MSFQSRLSANEVMRFYRGLCTDLIVFNLQLVGLGGLGVTCSPRDPRFAVSNSAEVDGFFPDVKILSTSPPGGAFSWGSRV